MKRFLRGFGYAFAGIGACIKEERHFRVHLAFILYVTTLATYFHLSTVEWAILILTMGSVLVAEAANTAIERVVDLTSPTRHPLAKAAKDIAAGMVLLAALTSVGVAVFLLTDGDGWRRMLSDFKEHLWKPIILLASLPLTGWLALRTYSTKNHDL